MYITELVVSRNLIDLGEKSLQSCLFLKLMKAQMLSISQKPTHRITFDTLKRLTTSESLILQISTSFNSL